MATIDLACGAAGAPINESLAFDIREACRKAIEDDQAYVVLIAGARHAFALGGDRPNALNTPTSDRFSALRVSGAVAAIPKPTLAAIDGDAFGQGLEIAIACDLRIAGAGSRFAMDQVLHGFMPWDGGTQRLPRLVSRGLALEMILTGRTIESTEAREIGLVSEVVPAGVVLQRGQQLAEKLAAMAPIATAYAKEAVWKGMDMPLGQGLRLEADLAVLLHTTHDRAEGLQAFLQRRAPKFTGE